MIRVCIELQRDAVTDVLSHFKDNFFLVFYDIVQICDNGHGVGDTIEKNS